MVAQEPAVVIIARHGPRLDLADSTWHLSTPTPYDPPLTYGGWNQSRALGLRIASLLHAREQSLNGAQDGSSADEMSQLDEHGKRKVRDATDDGPRKRRRVKHNVVIHSSPFLRCLQTSVGIAAGIAQFNSGGESGSKHGIIGKRLHSGSPRLLASEGHGSPNLTAIAEPKHDFAHEIARRALNEHKRYRKSKLRVDAFLGEWLNPQYFEQITPPPPSPMMVATAKAELMQNETVEIFTPSNVTTKSSNSSLWGGGTKGSGQQSPLDDLSPVEDALPMPTSPTRRDRTSSHSSVGSTESGRKSPFRPGSALQPLTSILPKQEAAIYHPPTPHYAVSTTHQIPRGYVTHARNACANVDYQWDSSRPPQNWGDGGEYGEEWSSMHKRFRRGLNHAIHWYSQHNVDDRGEDALGIDQAERDEDEEVHEDLVLILVTHGAGCNALIGALTGQPVLLDVGMASLTMAIRKDDAPPLSTSPAPMNAGDRRRSLDMGLSSIYDMKLVSSSEHLRPGAELNRAPSTSGRPDLSNIRDPLSRHKARMGGAASHGTPGTDVDPYHYRREPPRSNTSAALGTIRRPSAQNTSSSSSSDARSSSLPRADGLAPPTPPLSTGLWTPPAARTPLLQAQTSGKDNRPRTFSRLSDSGQLMDPTGGNMVLDFSNSPPDSRPGTSSGTREASQLSLEAAATSTNTQVDGSPMDTHQSENNGRVRMSKPADDIAHTGATKGNALWGKVESSGSRVERTSPRDAPKRRWTVNQD